ncbi:hypothetical protein H671_1g1239 [Cricetulus griseus]|nr:hypothetical protein H671_1g1239 [Cricetulus griseus]
MGPRFSVWLLLLLAALLLHEERSRAAAKALRGQRFVVDTRKDGSSKCHKAHTKCLVALQTKKAVAGTL